MCGHNWVYIREGKGEGSLFVLLATTLLLEEIVLVLSGRPRREILGLLHRRICQIQQILLFQLQQLLLRVGLKERIDLLRCFGRGWRRSLDFLHWRC